MMFADRRNILEIWSKVFGVFGENVGAKYVSELEEKYSVLWRKHVRRFGENVFDDFGKNLFGDFWR